MPSFECELHFSAIVKSRTAVLAREEFIDLLIYGRLFNRDNDKVKISVKRMDEREAARS